MRLRHLALITAVGLLSAACSPGGAASGAASLQPSSPPPAAATRVEVRLTDALRIEPDALRIEPDAMSVPAGVSVTFVVTNSGALDHEFYLGDEAAQAEHEQEMASMGGMTHDEPEGIAVDPGETKELTFTFTDAGETLAGCHVAGHYAAGMKAMITVGG